MVPSATTVVLTPEQQAVVDHRGGPLQVIACAGSGKTESVSRRIADALSAKGAASTAFCPRLLPLPSPDAGVHQQRASARSPSA